MSSAKTFIDFQSSRLASLTLHIRGSRFVFSTCIATGSSQDQLLVLHTISSTCAATVSSQGNLMETDLIRFKNI